MDGQALQQRVKAIKLKIAAIHDAESRYKLRGVRSPIEKAARRAALEAIKVELASLLPATGHRLPMHVTTGQTALDPS
jgi:hypothetical protein